MTRRSFLLLAAASGWAGCQPPERDRCFVRGRATLGGQPLAGFQVALYSEATGGGSAEVGPDGAFAFPGPVQEGTYTVSFVIPVETKGAARAKLEAMNLPPAYRRSETSKHEVTLTPGDNNLEIEIAP